MEGVTDYVHSALGEENVAAALSNAALSEPRLWGHVRIPAMGHMTFLLALYKDLTNIGYDALTEQVRVFNLHHEVMLGLHHEVMMIGPSDSC